MLICPHVFGPRSGAAAAFLFLGFVACNGAKTSDDDSDDAEGTDDTEDTEDANDTDGADTDTPSDTDDTDVPDCDVLPDGTYDASGNCFHAAMTVGLTMDATACTFTLDDWSMMTHSAPAEGGAVAGETVTLTGGDLDGCTGTIDGDTATGLCPDQCVWELAFKP